MGCGASSARVAADAYAADASPPAKIAADPSSSSAASEPPTAAKPDGVASRCSCAAGRPRATPARRAGGSRWTASRSRGQGGARRSAPTSAPRSPTRTSEASFGQRRRSNVGRLTRARRGGGCRTPNPRAERGFGRQRLNSPRQPAELDAGASASVDRRRRRRRRTASVRAGLHRGSRPTASDGCRRVDVAGERPRQRRAAHSGRSAVDARLLPRRYRRRRRPRRRRLVAADLRATSDSARPPRRARIGAPGGCARLRLRSRHD